MDFMVEHPFAGVWVDIGGGKTLTTLTALQQIRPIGHILVIAPVAIARSTWLNEIDDWAMPIRTRSLIANERDRPLSRAARLERFQEVFTDPPTMYFINQDLISRSPQKNCQDCQGNGVKIGACRTCQTGLVDQMPIQKLAGPDGTLRDTIIWPFQTVIIDESQEFKSHSSNRFKALKRVRPAITRLIELTGTPAPNGLEDLWSQVYLLDQGQALGQTITEFRDRWFTPKMVPGVNAPASWVPNPGAEQEIHDAIKHLVMSVQNTSLQLPELNVEDVPVTLEPELLQAYRDFRRELVLDIVNQAAYARASEEYDRWLETSTDQEAQDIRDELASLRGDALDQAAAAHRQAGVDSFLRQPDANLIHSVIAANQAVLTSKLMQFASGTLYTADPDVPSTKGRYEVIHNAKIVEAARLILAKQGEPVLVAYHFKSDKEQLLTQLNAMGIKAEAFDGSRHMIRRWNDKDIAVMLIHPASAGAGLNLQHGGSTLIWFTLPFALKHYMQTNGRLYRMGQKQPVTIYRLLTSGTQDDRMPVVLATKQLTQDRLIQAVDIEQALVVALEEELADDLNDLWTTTRL